MHNELAMRYAALYIMWCHMGGKCPTSNALTDDQKSYIRGAIMAGNKAGSYVKSNAYSSQLGVRQNFETLKKMGTSYDLNHATMDAIYGMAYMNHLVNNK